MAKLIAIVVYVVVWFFTFGWTYNRFEPRCFPSERAPGVLCIEDERPVAALLSATFWPVVWPVSLSIELTKP